MKKIGLVVLHYDENLGDPLMVQCIEYFWNFQGFVDIKLSGFYKFSCSDCAGEI